MNFDDYKPVMSHIQPSRPEDRLPDEENAEYFHGVNNGSAKSVAKKIYHQIQIVEKDTDYFEEVGIMLFQHGQKFEFSVSQVGYHDPCLICFTGYMNNDSPIKLVQHVSQLNFIVFKMKRSQPNTPKQAIKFEQV